MTKIEKVQENRNHETLSDTTNELNLTSKLSSIKENQALLSSIAFRAAHRYSMGPASPINDRNDA